MATGEPVVLTEPLTGSPSLHPPYFEMIKDAITTLNESTGSSRYAITKFIEENQNNLPANFKKVLLTQLNKLVADGKLLKDKASYKLPAAGVPAAGAPAKTVAMSRRQRKHDSYAKALKSGSKEAALQILKEEQPRDYRLRFRRLSANLEMIFQPPKTPWMSPYPLSSFTNVPQAMQKWADGYFSCEITKRPDRPMSIIIEGQPGTGKTMWARSLGKHNYLCGHFNLNQKVFSNDAEYNVIDDIDPHKLKYWKQLLGAKTDWTLNCKYEKLVQIKGGIPAIVLCRPGKGYSYIEYLNRPKNEALKTWTSVNAIFVVLQQPLFSTLSEMDLLGCPKTS